MQPLDFVMYCVGFGTVVVSCAVAVRLVRPAAGLKPAAPAGPALRQHASDPADELQVRMHDLRGTRFAPNIVRWPTSCPDDEPQLGQVRAFSQPPQPQRTPQKVVPLPMKMRPPPDDGTRRK